MSRVTRVSLVPSRLMTTISQSSRGIIWKATRLPLWGCYGLVGGAVGAFGAGLLVGGMRKAGDVHLAAPPQSLAALKENLAWIGDQATRMTSPEPTSTPSRGRSLEGE